MTSDWVHGFGHTPVCKILLQMRSSTSIVAPPPTLTHAYISKENDSVFLNTYTNCIFNQFNELFSGKRVPVSIKCVIVHWYKSLISTLPDKYQLAAWLAAAATILLAGVRIS